MIAVKFKICSCCGIELPLKMFHKDRRFRRNGLQSQCKICRALNVNEKKHRIRQRKWDRKYREKYPVTTRIKQRIWLEKHSGYENEVNAKYRKRHRKQVNVANMARRYLRKGVIKRKNACKKCGALNPIMHHEDYDKPLEVIWLCRKCHGKRHRKGCNV